MVRYLVCGCYLSGPHEGEKFLLRKGGHVVGDAPVGVHHTYEKKSTAKTVVSKLNRRAERDIRDYPSIFDRLRYTVYEVNFEGDVKE